MRQPIFALLLLGAASAPVAAQSRAAMGVAVTVVTAAPTASITRSASTYARRDAETVEVSSRLALVSMSAYTLRLRADSAVGGADNAVLVRGASGRFERVANGTSALLARSTDSTDARQLDLVVRMASSTGRAALTAELVTERLDQ